MKIAIYTRVSTEHQVEEGVSLKAQLKALEEYAKKNDYEIYKHYSDEGITGTSIKNRTQYKQMLSDMKKNLFSKIIFYKSDRISRSLMDLLNLINLCKEYNCELISLTEPIDSSTPQGLAFIQMNGVFAELEAGMIKSRVKQAIDYKVSNGEVITTPPYGYKIGIEDNKKILIQDEKKGIVVKDIFKTYIQTHSLQKTIDTINYKYPTLTYKNGFSKPQIKRIINNPIYYGEFRNNENYCKYPYITKKEFEEAQRIKKEHTNTRVNKYNYLFTGIIKGTCGHTYNGRTYKKNNYIASAYFCSQNSLYGKCKYNSILESRIEKEVLDLIPKKLNDYLNKQKKQVQILAKKTNDIETKLKKLESEKQRVITSFQKGWITEENADTKIYDINTKINELKSQNVENSITKISTLVEKINNSNWLDMYNNLTKDNKKIFLRSFINYVIVDVDKYKKNIPCVDIELKVIN